jgi:hypothetical protein
VALILAAWTPGGLNERSPSMGVEAMQLFIAAAFAAGFLVSVFGKR